MATLVKYKNDTIETFNIKTLGRTFTDKTDILSVEIGNEVSSIDSYAFSGCTCMTSITISDTVTSIGSMVFYGCCCLKKIVINSTVPPSVGNNSFKGIRAEGTLYCPDNSDYTSWLSKISYYLGYYKWINYSFIKKYKVTIHLKNGLIETDYMESDSIPDEKYIGRTDIISVDISDTITNIGKRAFQKCTCLTEIVIPNTVTSIKDYTFYGCTSLTSVTIGTDVMSIGEGAFASCKSLKTINIPNSVKEIGVIAFDNCLGLSDVTIGSGCINIGYAAFSHCTGLTTITCYATTAPSIDSQTFFKINENGTLYYPDDSDYSNWLSEDKYYLQYYGWTGMKSNV